ncbi:unnamed protein product [Diamesa serratosioi]
MKVILVFIALVVSVTSLDNGLAKTPPMGWMSWERFRCITDCDKYPDDCISERLFKEMADVMVRDGYLAAGYEYVNIDDCWAEFERDKSGKMVADKKRFPSGMKALADYIHSKGLKFGLYGDYGTLTCAGYPGSIDHLEIDAKSLAEWDVDFFKFDGCNVETDVMVDGYVKFGQLMNKTGRPIMYSCSWPAYFEHYRKPATIPDYEILKKTCNLWRNWRDIDDSWESVLFIADYFSLNQDRVAPHAGPGHWNDPDTLLLGNYGLSYDQSKAQLAMWAVLAAPFLLSTDLRHVKPEIKELLLNREIIAVDQDAMGIQGRLEHKANGIEIWSRPILPIVDTFTSYAVAFVNRRNDGAPSGFAVKLSDIKLNCPSGYQVQDLFNKTKKSYNFKHTDSFEERINPTGANFYKFTPIAEKDLQPCCQFPSDASMMSGECMVHLEGLEDKEEREKWHAYSCFTDCYFKSKGMVNDAGELQIDQIKEQTTSLLDANNGQDFKSLSIETIDYCTAEIAAKKAKWDKKKQEDKDNKDKDNKDNDENKGPKCNFLPSAMSMCFLGRVVRDCPPTKWTNTPECEAIKLNTTSMEDCMKD